MNLFQLGDFTLASGAKSAWKIECDALTKGDWEAIAAMAVELLPIKGFTSVVGVPRGGMPFADALRRYELPPHVMPFVPTTLIAEDVVTTGGSIQRVADQYKAFGHVKGVCLFARGKCPPWVHPLLRLPGA